MSFEFHLDVLEFHVSSPRRLVIRLGEGVHPGEPEKSCCKFLGDFCGPIFEESMTCSRHGLSVVG